MRRLLTVVGCLALGLAWLPLGSGCVSKDRLAEAEREVDQLKRLSALQESSLSRTEDALSNSRERERQLREERDQLERQYAEASQQLSAATALAHDFESQQQALSERAESAERALERDRTRLKGVLATAAEQVEELTRLRAEANDVAEKESALRAANASLKTENTRVRGELEKLRSDLLAANAVIRSISAGESKAHEAQTALLQEKVRQLEEERHALLDQRDELTNRLAEGKTTTDEPEESAATVVAAASAPRSVTAGRPWEEFLGFVETRAKSMARGESSWDHIDITIVSVASGVLLVLLWVLFAPLRWKRALRRRRELKALRERVATLETNGSRSSSASRRGPRHGSTVVRRSSGFSPILAPAEDRGVTEEEEEDVEEDVEEETYDQLTVQLGALEPTGSDPRAGDADEEEPSAVEAWDDEDEDEEDDEFANTQIIPSLSELEDLGARPQPAKSATSKRGGSDQEFMNELKQMIGRKVDEMIQ